MHLYRPSRPWQVALLAVIASAGAVLLAGAVTTALPDFRVEAPTQLQQFPKQTAKQEPPSIQSPKLALGPDQAAPREEWRIQVGAFGRSGAAEAQIAGLASRLPELSTFEPQLEEAGPLTRARFGDIGDAETADNLCARVVEYGSECIVVPPER